ncbi:hypothetical protein DYBT9275_05615 [Dyadobacter sp. CECT 9275]|uniref:Uncharacterized protein n=1 Tax=Dyadobacter helix TaxID=2822344 RepID=A0A916NNS2_9BACT|nr:hypothetical protein DYBT9275_05615 [Dyadobacter sp. CECT 9275]
MQRGNANGSWSSSMKLNQLEGPGTISRTITAKKYKPIEKAYISSERSKN